MKRAIISSFAFLALVACGGEASESGPTTAAANEPQTEQGNAAPAPQADQAPAVGGGEEGGGEAAGSGESACARARACCNAYVEALGGAAAAGQACAGIETAEQVGGATADASCTSMISGWRTALSGMGREIPAACN
jgi:hypothetical protein